MPPSFYCKPRRIKAERRSTGNSLAPPTQVAFMNNQSKKCLSEQHCRKEPSCHRRLASLSHIGLQGPRKVLLSLLGECNIGLSLTIGLARLVLRAQLLCSLFDGFAE